MDQKTKTLKEMARKSATVHRTLAGDRPVTKEEGARAWTLVQRQRIQDAMIVYGD